MLLIKRGIILKKLSLILIISILSLLLFILPVSAEKKVFDDWVSHNDTIKINEFEYKVLATENLLILENTNNSGKLVLIYNITEDMDGVNWLNMGKKYRGFDEDENITDIHSDDPYIFEYHLYVTVPTHTIKVSREFLGRDNYVFDDYQLQVVVKNSGDEDLKYLTYSEEIPDFLIFKEAREVDTGRVLQITDSSEKRIDWAFNIKQGEAKKIVIDYELAYFDNDKEYMFNPAQIIYKINDKEMVYDIKSSKINFEEPLVVSFISFSKRLDYGDEVDSKIRFSNSHETESVYLDDIYIRIPEGLEILDFDDSVIDEVTKEYLHIESLKVDQDSYEEIPVEFQSFISGNAEVVVEYDYTFNNKKITSKAEKQFATSFDEPSIDLDISTSDDHSFRSGKLGYAQYSFFNNQDVELENVLIEISSNFFNKKSILLEKVAAKRISEDVLTGKKFVSSGSVSDNISFQFPFVESKEKRVVSLVVRYSTKDGEERIVGKNISIEILPEIKKSHFSYSGFIESYEKSEYYVRLYIHKTSDEVPSAINFTVFGEGFSQNVSFSDRESYGFRAEGQKRKYYLNIPIDPAKNESAYELHIKSKALIDGFVVEQEESFVLNPLSLEFTEKEEVLKANFTTVENETVLDDSIFEKENNSALDDMSEFFTMIFKSTIFKIFVGIFLVVLLGVILYNIYSKSEAGGSGFSMNSGGRSNSMAEMDGFSEGKDVLKNDFKHAETLYDEGPEEFTETSQVLDIGFENKKR